MGDTYSVLQADHQEFIKEQKIYFVASADATGRINLSPKGHDSLVVTNPQEIIWLNLTGSGNETAAHLRHSNRITIMWCAFTGPPNILRVYGSAETIHPRDAAWQQCAQQLEPMLGARQYFRMSIDSVLSSCGYGVPTMEYVENRSALTKWTEKKGQQGIEDYWQDRNQQSLDGIATDILKAQRD